MHLANLKLNLLSIGGSYSVYIVMSKNKLHEFIERNPRLKSYISNDRLSYNSPVVGALEEICTLLKWDKLIVNFQPHLYKLHSEEAKAIIDSRFVLFLGEEKDEYVKTVEKICSYVETPFLTPCELKLLLDYWELVRKETEGFSSLWACNKSELMDTRDSLFEKYIAKRQKSLEKFTQQIASLIDDSEDDED